MVHFNPLFAMHLAMNIATRLVSHHDLERGRRLRAQKYPARKAGRSDY